METILHIIIAYVVLVIIYQTWQAIKKYLRSQKEKREAGEISGYSFGEIVIYGFFVLITIFTVGLAGTLLFANSCTDDKELKS